jgi:threonine dehydrogenase-like Zn-dependent dehydrogenase
VGKELNVQFVLGYDPMEFGTTLRRIAEGELDVAPMITGEVPLDGVPQAFRDLADPEAHAKILVRP